MSNDVLHLITGLGTGGAEKALYNLLNGGLAARFHNQVCSLSDLGTIGPQIRELGIPVITLDMPNGRPTFSGLIKLRNLIGQIKPGVIQGWMYHGNLAATVARTFTPGNVSLVWNIRQSLYDLSQEKPLTRQVIRANSFFSSAPNILLYNSRLSRKQHQKFGFISANGRVIPNGIDTQQFSFSAKSRKRVRTELCIPADAFVIGHVARLHPMKDHPVFLAAATELANSYPQAHFLLSGRNVTYKKQLIAQSIPLTVRDRFHLLGERSDVPELMSAMDIFCQSSFSEAFPNVLGEAMATGIPCVATDVGDSSVIIGDTGVLVPSSNVQSLATGIESLLIMSVAERYALGAKARARIEDNYTLGAIVDQYTMMYEQLIAESGRERSCVES